MIKKYRKRPVVVEAMLWYEQNIKELIDFVGKDNLIIEHHTGSSADGEGYLQQYTKVAIKTLEGTSYELTNNDWIIKGVKGEFYPCKPDIFKQTYEEVEG